MSDIDTKSKFKRNENAPWKEIEKECIILNLENGDYHTLDEIGLFIWKSFDGKKSLEAIAKSIAARYDVAPTQALKDLLAFSEKMRRLNFVEISG